MQKNESASGLAKRRERLLAGGALLGLVLAFAGLLPTASDESALAANSVAQVNGMIITKAEYHALLTQMESKIPAGNKMTAKYYRQLLNSQLEERLLAQRAQQLGLSINDQRLRKVLAAAMMEWVVDVVDRQPIDETELVRLFETQPQLFQRQRQWRVMTMRFHCGNSTINTDCGNDQAAAVRAKAAATAVRGGQSFLAVKQEMADNDWLPLSSHYLSVKELHHQLGKKLAEQVPLLADGQLSEPFISANAYHLLLVFQKVNDQLTFQQLREQVLEEYLQRARQRELRRYLDELKQVSDITIDEDYLQLLPRRSVNTATAEGSQ